ncbi:MAG TPA: FHA domain-containing protein [Anaerolineales bacterium]|nr:FHA domain-containing protein [Anaerolineales bacterium]
MRKSYTILIFLSLLALPLALAAPRSAHAQTEAYAEIVLIDAQKFPEVSALVDVYDASGQFVAGLRPGDLTAYEDGQPRPVNTLSESPTPVQMVVAVNPGPALAVRNGEGIQRFEQVVGALSQWVQAQPDDSNDDLSLVSLSGSLITHAKVRDWFVSLDSFKPDFRNTTPNLQTLSIALDTVLAPVPQPGMKRAILFVTPHMDDPNIDNTIAPLIQQAMESKVRVFVWFVDGEVYFPTASANAFKSLALQTGGTFFAFSGIETFPDLDVDLAPLRHSYSLTYTSALSTAGGHSLGLTVRAAQGVISALDKNFNLDVQPPNPILVSPPLQITRQPPAEDPYNPDLLIPEQQALEIIVEFPDGHPRELERTSLYVDGQLVAENTSEPFEKFLWDLSVYERSGQHEVVVRAEDVLGLEKSSIGTPITLTVIQPPRGIQALLARYRPYLVMGAIGLAGLALLVILLRGRAGGPLFRGRREIRKHFEDPVTQPVVTLTESSVSATKKAKTQPRPRRAGWLQPKAARVAAAPAYLIRLTNGGEPASVSPIPVAEKEITFGTDPVQSLHVLDDASISPLHARIKQAEDGGFVIYDHGSIAGTWVNYEPVPREGCRLAHGDRVHFGQLSYRFDLNQPPAVPEPKILSKKPVP